MPGHAPPMDPELVDELSGRMHAIAQEVFADAMTGMIAKGSAIKGDFIPDYSDFDVHIFARDEVMRAPLVPHASIAIPFQERFSAIDIGRYRVSQIQVMVISASEHPPDWVPAMPGAYRLISGSLPDGLPEITDDLLRQHARDGLVRWSGWVDTVLARIIDKSDGQLADNVRLTGTIMKAALYEAAIVLGDTPTHTWRRPLTDVLAMVEPDRLPDRQATRFFEHAWRWADVRQDGSVLRTMLADGISVLEVLTNLPDGHEMP